MRYAQIRNCDVANGEGIRTSLYVQGCSRHCEGCFNKETWDFKGGKPWDEEIERQFLQLIGKPHIVGTTILGGEPLDPQNIDEVHKLVEKIKGRYPNKTIWIYTSYLYEELLEDQRALLEKIDVLVDGEFIENEKSMNLQFKGSQNQRVIRVGESLKEGEICLYN